MAMTAVSLRTIRFLQVLSGWLMMSSFMLMFLFALIYLQELFKAFNIPMDLLTVGFMLYNFGVAGIGVRHQLAHHQMA